MNKVLGWIVVWVAFSAFVYFGYNNFTDGWVDGGDNGDVLVFALGVAFLIILIGGFSG
jgi:hypothetical protein